MTEDQTKIQLCEIMLTMEHVQRQFEQLSQYKQQLLQQLQEMEKIAVVQEEEAIEEQHDQRPQETVASFLFSKKDGIFHFLYRQTSEKLYG